MPNPHDSIPLEFSMDEVVSILVNDLGLAAYVEQTGGGVATIYAGVQRPAPGGARGEKRWAAVAGPGTYGWGRKQSTASLVEFWIGPDDQGEADAIDAATVGARTPRHIATLISAQARRKDPSQPLTDEQLDVIGFDASGRLLLPEVARIREETRVHIAAANAENHRRIAAGEPYDEAARARQDAAGAAAVEARNQ